MASAAAYQRPSARHAGPKEEADFQTYLDFSAISPAVQKHIQKVYLTLAACLLVVVVGAYADSAYHLGGILSYFGTIGCILGLVATPATPANENIRLSLLVGTAFFKGCSLGPLLQAVADMDSSLISTAFLATSAVFAAFSGAALLAKRREYLYLGGLCGSAVSMLLATRLASYLFGTYVLQFQLELYLGLFVFAGYIIFDTQVMVERASMGVPDYIHDALQLLLDFVAVFVRILIILAKRQEDGGSKRERKENKRR